MSSLISSAKRSGRLGRGRGVGGAVAVAAGVVTLAVGCGTAHAPGTPGATASGTTASGTSPSAAVSGSTGSSSSSGGGTTTPTPAPTGVPTVSGGPVTAGEAACAGWPSGAASARLPSLFVPVAVEQCVTGIQDVPGKGTWETATLERATTNLTPLLNALREPGQVRSPGTFCSAVAVIPPQLVLIGGDGQIVVPAIPVTGCGNVRSGVLSALAALSWQPVSVRLVTPVSPDSVSPGTMKPGGSPKSIQTLGVRS